MIKLNFQKTIELNKLIKVLNELSKLEDIMQIVLWYILGKYHFPYYTLTILDSKDNKLKHSLSSLPEEISEKEVNIVKNITLPLDSSDTESLHLRAINDRKPMFISDAESYIKTDSGKFLLSVLKHKSFVILPIVLQNQPIGTIDLFSQEYVSLNEEDLIELSILSEQLAGIINGSLLINKLQEEKEKAIVANKETEKQKQEVEKSKAEIERIAEAMKMINAISSLPYIVQSMIIYLEEEFGFDTTFLLLVNENTNSLFANTIVANISTENLYFLKKLKIPLTKESGTLYATYNRRKILYLPRLPKKAKGIDFEIISRFGGKFILQVPLVIHDKTIGILNLSSSKEVIHLSKRNLFQLQLFADQIAGALR